MAFNINGLGILLIVLGIVSVQIVCHRGIKKVTNCYFFGLAIALFYLLYFLVFRHIPKGIDFMNRAPDFDPSISRNDATLISYCLLMEVCPFCMFGMTLGLIFDPSRQIARMFAPIAILYGFVIMCYFMFYEGTTLDPEYIFYGGAQGPLYVFMHCMNLIFGVGILLNTPGNGGKSFAITFGTLAFIYIGAIITSRATNTMGDASGTRGNDGTHVIDPKTGEDIAGEYAFIADALGIDYHYAPIIGFSILFGGVAAIVALDEYAFKKNSGFKYGNVQSKQGYFGYDVDKYQKQKCIGNFDKKKK